MKTTIEIPESLFRKAKAKAAMEGLSLRELFIRGLQLALQTTDTSPKKRADFPLIRSSRNTPPLRDEQVYAAIDNDEGLV
jgi:hypothetical protein